MRCSPNTVGQIIAPAVELAYICGEIGMSKRGSLPKWHKVKKVPSKKHNPKYLRIAESNNGAHSKDAKTALTPRNRIPRVTLPLNLKAPGVRVLLSEDPDLPEMDTAAEGAAEAESTSSAELQLEVEAWETCAEGC